jgi:hypothetical protein
VLMAQQRTKSIEGAIDTDFSFKNWGVRGIGPHSSSMGSSKATPVRSPPRFLQPAVDVVHGGLRCMVSTPDPPPRKLAVIGGGLPDVDRVQD